MAAMRRDEGEEKNYDETFTEPEKSRYGIQEFVKTMEDYVVEGNLVQEISMCPEILL